VAQSYSSVRGAEVGVQASISLAHDLQSTQITRVASRTHQPPSFGVLPMRRASLYSTRECLNDPQAIEALGTTLPETPTLLYRMREVQRLMLQINQLQSEYMSSGFESDNGPRIEELQQRVAHLSTADSPSPRVQGIGDVELATRTTTTYPPRATLSPILVERTTPVRTLHESPLQPIAYDTLETSPTSTSTQLMERMREVQRLMVQINRLQLDATPDTDNAPRIREMQQRIAYLSAGDSVSPTLGEASTTNPPPYTLTMG